MGFARLAESTIRSLKGKSEKEQLSAVDKILSSAIGKKLHLFVIAFLIVYSTGGTLATWNQPIEVVRVEMQSMVKNTSVNRPAKLTVFNTLKFIYQENGIRGLYRGVTPRIGLGIWQTVCMVSFADYVKAWYVYLVL